MHAHRLRKRIPPGPRGLPLLGNIFQIPTENMWERFFEWSGEYDCRSGIYADRPDIPMVNNILSGGMNLGFMHYGNFVEDKDRQVDEINSITYTLPQAIAQGSYLVNSIPDLVHIPTWFPGAGWKREGLEAHTQWTEKFTVVGDVREKL
ncbi:hypothetical protein PHLCEN_2v2505, partial [Hermanssonia centrifuga]